MSLVSLSLILTGVLLNAAAQLLLKAGVIAVGHFEFKLSNLFSIGGQILRQPYILGGFASYAISVVVWILALSRVPVSVAYPMLSIGYVINAIMAWWLFGESLHAQKLIGIAFVCLGVILLARS